VVGATRRRVRPLPEELERIVRDVNISGGPGRKMNCANCASAVDSSLAGHAATALPGGPVPATRLTEALGARWTRLRRPDAALDALERDLLQAGDGARAVVRGTRLSSGGRKLPGHVFNAVNYRGKVYYLDAQSPGAANLSGFARIAYARTN
jgi:filamentous hemagglutinin